MDNLEYSDIFKEEKGAMVPGRIKFAPQTITFKTTKTGKIENIQSSDIDTLHWYRLAKGPAIRIMPKSGILHRYSGFAEQEKEKLLKYVKKHYNKDLKDKELSIKGWNWGTAKFEGSVLNFEVDGATACEIPLNYVSHCTSAKNEVTMEFHQHDDAPVQLCEMRFFIPSDPTGATDTVELFQNNILEKADIIQATGDALVTFNELQCLTPRGRYDIKMFHTFIQLHGKTFDYKIPLNTVLRLFLLPHKDGRQTFFILSLDPPIKQGQTRYHFLILLFNKEDETSVTLSLSNSEIKEKYDDKIQKQMSGPTFDVISKIMKAMVQRKITVPGTFRGHSKTESITCSYRAVNGLLYPLERGFIFVHKPPMHIRFEEIASINFARSGGSTRSFDFEIELKNGTITTFNNIEKEEYGRLYDYVIQKNLKIKNRGNTNDANAYNEELIDSDLEEKEPDAYLERVKKEGRQRENIGGSDSDDESDVSFNPDAEAASDVAEEFDSNVEESSDSSDEDKDGKAAAKSGSGNESGGSAKVSKKKEKKKHKEKEHKPKKTVKEPGTRKPRKPKKERDENRPKRAPSAYFLWLADHRELIKKENPGFSITDVTKKAGEMWKNVTDKTKWEEEYKIKKEEYDKAMVEYKASGGGAQTSTTTTKVKKEKSTTKTKTPSKTKSSPKKKGGDQSRGDFKSKEYISSSADSSSDDDKPLVKKEIKKEETKMEVDSEASAGAKSGSDSDAPMSVDDSD